MPISLTTDERWAIPDSSLYCVSEMPGNVPGLPGFDADIQATDEQGRTATDLAKANKHRDITQYLQSKAPAKKIPDKKTPEPPDSPNSPKTSTAPTPATSPGRNKASKESSP